MSPVSPLLHVGPTEINLNATNRITKTYYSAGAQMVAMRVVTSTGGNTLYYLHSDHLGSTSLSTCGSGGCGTAGALVAGSRQSYYPFGAVRTAASSLPTDISFTGQRKDASTGLMFYNARYYDPVVGRFVSADTAVPDSTSTQAFNRYSYVNNNPVRSTDATGFCADADTACQDLVQLIYKLYGVNLVDGTAIWSAGEASSILAGFTGMAGQFSAIVGFDATSYVNDLFAGATFYRDEDVNGHYAEAFGGNVRFSDEWSALGKQPDGLAARRFFQAHEMGHLWDSRGTLFHLFMGDRSPGFEQAVGASTNIFRNPIYDVGPFLPGGVNARHRTDSAAEDWAESFASVMVPEYDNRNIGNRRETTVKNEIKLWVDYSIGQAPSGQYQAYPSLYACYAASCP